MERTDIPELNALMADVEKKFNHPLNTSTDFRILSAVLEYECREVLSASTLKRLWGYVSQQTTPRLATLDVLARYIGFNGFKEYRLSLLGGADEVSGYVDAHCISASEVGDDQVLCIGWEPDRLLKLRKKGPETWEIVSSRNSKLREGDCFEASCFFKGMPLFLPAVMRGGEKLPSYIAGKKSGLNVLVVES